MHLQTPGLGSRQAWTGGTSDGTQPWHSGFLRCISKSTSVVLWFTSISPSPLLSPVNMSCSFPRSQATLTSSVCFLAQGHPSTLVCFQRVTEGQLRQQLCFLPVGQVPIPCALYFLSCPPSPEEDMYGSRKSVLKAAVVTGLAPSSRAPRRTGSRPSVYIAEMLGEERGQGEPSWASR